ncbi:hypothetical protein D3C87_1498840 [compost metagenome]
MRFVGGSNQRGASLLQLRFEAVHFVLERTWIDLEQQIPFLDRLAIGEGDTIDLPRYPRTNHDGFRRFQTGGDFVPFGNGLLKHFGDGDRRRTRRLGGIGCVTAGRDGRQGQGSKGITQRFE